MYRVLHSMVTLYGMGWRPEKTGCKLPCSEDEKHNAQAVCQTYKAYSTMYGKT